MTHLLRRAISAEEYDALPEEVARRIEVIDGRIMMSPSPSLLHQLLVLGMAGALKAQCPAGLRVVCDFDLRLADEPLHVRRPDMMIFNADPAVVSILRPEHLTLVVEVVSPNSVTTDRLHKAAEYAAAGIPHYWRVELDLLEARTYAVTPLGYRETGMHKGRLVTAEPFTVEIDLEALLLG